MGSATGATADWTGGRSLRSGASPVLAKFKSKRAASLQPLDLLARPAGIEPTTPWFVARYSIQLSYGRASGDYIKLRPAAATFVRRRGRGRRGDGLSAMTAQRMRLAEPRQANPGCQHGERPCDHLRP